jgi:prefoldin subunit 5
MANPIVQQINAELESLQKELEQFKTTVEYLNEAEGHVNKSVQTVKNAETHFNKKVEELKNTYDSFIKLTDYVSKVISKLDTINFPERLDNIEKTVKETIAYLNETRRTTLEELQKASEIIVKADFDGRFKKLQNTIEFSVQSNEALAKTIESQKFPEKIDGFETNLNKKLESSIAELQKNTKQIATETSKSIHNLNLPVRMDKLDANIAGIMASVQGIQGRLDLVERNISDKLKTMTESQILYNAKLDKQISDQAKKQFYQNLVTWILIIGGGILLVLMVKLNLLK